MPPGIEFACPHCNRVAKVPVTLAGKQGRCAGCRRVIEVPAGGPATTGRTPDPDDGLLEVLDAKRASDRHARRASDRVDAAAPPRTSARGQPPVPEPEPFVEAPEESTAKITPPRPRDPQDEPFRVWARRVPKQVWFGLPLAVIAPALGVALCVFGLKPARARGAGERMAWWGIGIGSSILVVNLIYVAWKGLEAR